MVGGQDLDRHPEHRPAEVGDRHLDGLDPAAADHVGVGARQVVDVADDHLVPRGLGGLRHERQRDRARQRHDARQILHPISPPIAALEIARPAFTGSPPGILLCAAPKGKTACGSGRAGAHHGRESKGVERGQDVAAEAGGARRGDLCPSCRRRAGAEGRTQVGQSVHPARRGRALGADDRRRREQGDARPLRASPTRPKDARPRRSRARGGDQDDRPLPHQGEKRDRAVARARSTGTGARFRATATRSKPCPASAARPPTSSSTPRSGSRPSPSTRTSSASPTGSQSRRARRREKSRTNS